MPKEHVYGSTIPYGEEDPGRSVVEVRWSRESTYLQVATRCIRADDDTVYSNENLPTLTAADGWFVDLDRRGINDLIRKLRRARDQAFGRDE